MNSEEAWSIFNFYLQFNDREANEAQITAMLFDNLTLKYLVMIGALTSRKESRTKYYSIADFGWAELFIHHNVDIPEEHKRSVVKYILKS